MKINFFRQLIGIQQKRQKQYVLLSHRTNLEYKKFTKTDTLLSQKKPVFVDVVEILNTKDQTIKRITTYKNQSKKSIEKVFEHLNKKTPEPLIHRLYRYLTPETHKHKSIKGREITVFEKYGLDTYAQKKLKTEKQFLMKETDKNSKKTTLTISKVIFDSNDRSKELHTMAQYKSNENVLDETTKKWFIKKSGEKKHYQLEIEKTDNGYPLIKNITTSKNFVTPKNDDYFAMRLYNSDDVRVPITQKALIETNLYKLDIDVTPFDICVEKDTRASFYFEQGEIGFNTEFVPKPSIINSAFHEVKHALQHCIFGRGKKDNYSYSKKCFNTFGELKTDKEKNYANTMYKHSCILQTPGLTERQIKTNPIEIEARKYAEERTNNYYEKTKELLEQFRGVIKEEF